MTFLRLVRSEFARMTSSFTPLITIFGLALVPVLYAGIYLYANWDPYENLEGVDAALVNLDEGADFDGEHRTIGDDVAEELIDDASFGWEEVNSREAAEAGVASGKHQFALIIPEDFSEALASPSSFESADQAILDITTNEANNYLLSNIVSVLASEIHESVSSEVGQETADAMLTGFGQIHRQLVDAADGAAQLHDGAGGLRDGISELHDGSVDLADGAGDLDDGVDELALGLGELSEGSEQLSDGAGQLSTGASELYTGMSELQEGADAVDTAAGQLSDGASELNTGISTLHDGAEQVADGNEALSAASHEASDIISEFEASAEGRVDQAVQDLLDAGVIEQEQVEEAHEALGSVAEDSELLTRAQEARSQLGEAQENIDALATGSREVADGASELLTGSSALADGAAELSASTPDLSDGVGTARDGALQLSSGAADLSDGADEAHQGVGQLITGTGELNEGATALSDGAIALRDGLAEASDGSVELTDGAQELAEGLDDGADEVPNPDEDERQEISEVIGNPLKVNQTAQAEAGNYGAGMAPFFLALSLWIGALVMLQVLRPTSPRVLASNAPSASIALGSWIPFLLLSLTQSLLLYTAVVLGLGLTPAHPWLALALLFAASMAFSALVQGVVALLGNPGKMLMILLLVLQLVASGGTFPPQTLPEPLQALHPVLPMSYVVDGLRHVIYGADLATLSTSLAALLATTGVGLTLLVLAIRKKKMWSLKRLQPAIEEAA
ncbi:YhgE/Pip family protein [Nesterenkonia sp. K-15-9-6]|uniref:YhgE/Pip family protein n=1 Tax=Nesterenkonia sp. K-15-9-6 TaxID=3093918 RepID=UPI004043CE4A